MIKKLFISFILSTQIFYASDGAAGGAGVSLGASRAFVDISSLDSEEPITTIVGSLQEAVENGLYMNCCVLTFDLKKSYEEKMAARARHLATFEAEIEYLVGLDRTGKARDAQPRAYDAVTCKFMKEGAGMPSSFCMKHNGSSSNCLSRWGYLAFLLYPPSMGMKPGKRIRVFGRAKTIHKMPAAGGAGVHAIVPVRKPMNVVDKLRMRELGQLR